MILFEECAIAKHTAAFYRPSTPHDRKTELLKHDIFACFSCCFAYFADEMHKPFGINQIRFDKSSQRFTHRSMLFILRQGEGEGVRGKRRGIWRIVTTALGCTGVENNVENEERNAETVRIFFMKLMILLGFLFIDSRMYVLSEAVDRGSIF